MIIGLILGFIAGALSMLYIASERAKHHARRRQLDAACRSLEMPVILILDAPERSYTERGTIRKGAYRDN